MKVRTIKHKSGFVETIRTNMSAADEARWFARVANVKTFPSANHRRLDPSLEEQRPQQMVKRRPS